MAEEAIKFKVSAEGAEKTAAQFKLLSGGLQAANDNYKKLSETASKTATTVAAFGGALGRLDPQLGAFGAAVGRASGSVQAMTAVLGGPWGLAIGAAVTALGLFAEHMRDAKDETDEFTRAIEENQAAIERAQALRGTKGRYAATMLQASDILADASGLTDDAQRKNLEAIVKKYEETGGIGDNIADKKPGKDPNDPFLSMQRRDAVDAQLKKLRGMEGGGDKSAGMDAVARRKAENEAFLEADKDRFAETLELARENDRELAEIDDQRRKRYDELRAAGFSTFSAVASHGLNSFQMLAKGQKQSVREIVSGIGDTIAAQGQGHLLLGLANAFIPGMQGTSAGLIGIGTAEIVAGAAMGAATRGGGRGGGGGGGGGRSRSESPISASASAGSGGGPTTVIVNMPTVVSPDANVAAMIVKHIDEGMRAGTVQRTRDGGYR